MAVDLSKRDVDGESNEEELLLLCQPHQPHLHLPLRVAVLQPEVLAAVAGQARPHVDHSDADGRADAPEGPLELVQQRQRQDAAVLRGNQTYYSCQMSADGLMV